MLEKKGRKLMKFTKKLLAVLMAFAMTLSLTSVFASAKANNQYRGKSMVVLGDSIAAGFGLDKRVPDEMIFQGLVMAHGEFLEDSWPQRVRDHYGFSKENSYNISRSGWSTTEFLRILDPEFEKELCQPENAFDQYVSDYCFMPEELTQPGDIARVKAQIEDAIANADVIFFALGSNDIMTYSICKEVMRPAIYPAFGRQAALAVSLISQGEFGTIDSTEEALQFIYGKLDLNLLPQDIEDSTQRFFQQYERMMDIIYDLKKPDAEVYDIGITAPFRHMEVMTGVDEVLLRDLNEKVIKDVADYMTKNPRCKYIDVSDAEGHEWPQLVNPFFLMEFINNVHPTAEGHGLMANDIYKVVG